MTLYDLYLHLSCNATCGHSDTTPAKSCRASLEQLGKSIISKQDKHCPRLLNNQFTKHLGLSENRGTPIAGWFTMENPIKMDDFPHLVKNLHVSKTYCTNCSKGNIWRFPEIRVPANHPLKSNFPLYINHQFLGSPILGNPHMETCSSNQSQVATAMGHWPLAAAVPGERLALEPPRKI